MKVYWKVYRRPNQTLWVRMSTDQPYPFYRASHLIHSRKDVPAILKKFVENVRLYEGGNTE